VSYLTKRNWGDVEPQIQRTFEAFWSARGNVPNLFRVLAHVPSFYTTFQTHFKTVMGPGLVDVRIKELVAMRVSQLNRCRYCLASHTVLARQHGATEDMMSTLGDLDRSPLPENEKAAIRFAEKMTTNADSITPDDIARMRAHWSEPETVEIACVVGLFNYLNRFANALGFEPTKPGEGGPDSKA
jgi:uncharacterized peroxidase-related enzyme